MKKFLLLVSALVLVFGLSACKGELECPEGQVEQDGKCVEPSTSGDDYYDADATYKQYISGVTNINPYSQMMSTSSEIFGYITDSLYTGDYDWETAIAEGLALEEGDFETAGAEALGYVREPAMAAGEPVDVNGDGKVWEIELRSDLVFEDGTAINAETFEWSWKQLLDPDQLNIRASVLYQDTSLPVLNAEKYYKQKTPDKDELGFEIYKIGEVVYKRENALDGHFVGHEDWPAYIVEKSSPWNADVLVGPDGAEPKLELWGYEYSVLESYGYITTTETSWFLETHEGNTFKVNADGELRAPEEGWTLNGVAVPLATEDDTVYASALPAYMDDQGNYAPLDEDGLPENGVYTYEDAVTVEWSEVGIKATDTLTLQITLSTPRTAWDVKGKLMSGITGVVHKESYEEGMNDLGTQTTYGTIENPLVSYGAYVMSTWQAETIFIFDINEDWYAHEDYRIKHIRYEFIEDQSVAVEEFKLGNLDVTGAGGDYFDDFEYAPNLKLSPNTTFFRFAFNLDGSDTYDANPILNERDFRHAFYYAIDRDEFVTEVRAPGYPTQGLLGPKYTATEYNSVSYRGSEAGTNVLADFSPETYGYNPTKAKELFDDAYQALVDAGTIADGDKVSVEYLFYDVETNWKVANWAKSTVEAIFNEGQPEDQPLFELTLKAASSDALDQAWDAGHFDITFGGWTGYDFDAAKMLGEVYNSVDTDTMLEVGFDTENAEITVKLEKTYDALATWMADYEALAEPSDTQTDKYEEWEVAIAKFDVTTKEITCTYNELFQFAYGAFYNVEDVNYDGKTDDFNAIASALESVLLDQMINIPLFTRVGATVYSNRVVLEADAYHAWMGWGGLKYMYIKAYND